MRRSKINTVLAVSLGVLGPSSAPAQSPLRVASPDGRNAVTVELREGVLRYSVQRQGRLVILPSRLGFEFRGAPALGNRHQYTLFKGFCPVGLLHRVFWYIFGGDRTGWGGRATTGPRCGESALLHLDADH